MGVTVREDVPAIVRRMVEALTTRPGALPPAVRSAIVERAAAMSLGRDTDGDVPEDLRPYADKVTQWAYKVVDGDVEQLRRAGWSDDAAFEATLCAATGAALARFERGLELLHEAGPRAD